MAAAPTQYASSLIASLRGGADESKGPQQFTRYISGATASRYAPVAMAALPSGGALSPEILSYAPRRPYIADTTNTGLAGEDFAVTVPTLDPLDRFNPTVDYEEPLDPILDVPSDPVPDEVGTNPETGVVAREMDRQDQLQLDQPKQEEVPDYIYPPSGLPAVEQVIIEGKKPNDEVVFEPDDQYVQLTLDEVLPPIDSLPINVAPEQPAEQPADVPQIVIEAPRQSVPEPVLAPEQVPDIAPEDLFVPPGPETVAIPEVPPIEVAAPAPSEPPAGLREVIEAAVDQAPPPEPVQPPVPLQEVIEAALDQAPPPEAATAPSPDEGLVDAVSVAEAVGIPAEVAQQVGITESTNVTAAPVEEPSYDPAMDVLYVPESMLDMGGAGAGSMDDFMMEDWV